MRPQMCVSTPSVRCTDAAPNEPSLGRASVSLSFKRKNMLSFCEERTVYMRYVACCVRKARWDVQHMPGFKDCIEKGYRLLCGITQLRYV